MELLNKKKIVELLQSKNIDVQVVDTVDSTNDYVKQYKTTEKIIVCLAEQQTQGRGRFNRNWHSPFGENIYLSLAYPSAKKASELAGLSIVIALSLCNSIDAVYRLPHPTFVKWPNDVIYDAKKLAGNLIEIQTLSQGDCLVIVGVGINVNMLPEKDLPITQPWTSIREITQNFNDRNILCARLIDNLVKYVNKFFVSGLSVFLQEWQTRDYLYNKAITLQVANNRHKGKASGINAQGHLLLKTDKGELLEYSAGEASVVKGNS